MFIFVLKIPLVRSAMPAVDFNWNENKINWFWGHISIS